MSIKGMCSDGHIISKNLRLSRCPFCVRNLTRRLKRVDEPRKIAENLTKGRELWVEGLYPIGYAKIIARAYLRLLKRSGA